MTFVFPILLGGLALLIVPILIHLIFRQKPRTLRFPAFRFLMQKSRTNLRKLQLRHLLLLMMRLLLLALICLAVARPKVSGDFLNLQTDHPVAVVLLFDTSYSMQYKTTGDKSRLDEAREQAVRLLETLHSESRVLVLDTAERVPGQVEWLKRDKAIAQIMALALRPDNHPVTKRLEDAYQLFNKLAQSTDEELGRRLPRVLFVFSDRTEACWEPQHLPFLQTLADNIPPPLERLQAIQGGIAGKIALLKELREKLPPGENQDYPEQALLANWEELQQKIPSVNWDNFPSPDWTKLLSQARGRTRDLLKLLRAKDTATLSEEAKAFRQKSIEALETALKELQGVSAFFMDVGVDEPSDLGILGVDFFSIGNGSSEPRQTFAPKEKIHVQVQVQATGTNFTATLSCELLNKEIPKQPVDLKKGERENHSFVLGNDFPPGFHQVKVELSGSDQLPFNNRRFATFLIRPPQQLLIITDEPKTAELFKLAIKANEKVQLDCDVQATAAATTELEQKGVAALAKYQAVYLLNVAQPSATLWKTLKTYVEKGGNLGVIPGGEKLNKAAYNDDKNAQALLPGKLEALIKAQPGQVDLKTNPGAVWDWDDEGMYQHPFLKTFGDWKKIGRADFIQVPRWVYFFWKVTPVEAEKSVLVRYKSTQSAADKLPALLERDFGKGRGRVVLLTTRLDFHSDPAWNNYLAFDNNSWVVVLPGELSIYLAGDPERRKLNYLSGRGVAATTIPPSVGDLDFTLKGPTRQEVVPRAEKHNELLLWMAITPGNYLLTANSLDNPLHAFSVNIPPEEGSLKRVPVVDIEALFDKDAVRNFKPGDTFNDVMQDVLSRPAELMPILLVALLVLLALENLLGNLFYRREPKHQDAGVAS